MGIDLGMKRVGVAVSDDQRRVATAHTVLERTGDDDGDRVRLASVVADLGAGEVVVGLPLSLDGTPGPAARWAAAEAHALSRVLDVPLHLHDERLSTVTASRRPGSAGPRRRRPVPARRRQPVDATAAAVMLQSWLDARPPEGR